MRLPALPPAILLLPFLALSSVAAERPNILFIAVDDLRPELGCYGATHVHSPNIDKLAATGMLFERAYCQQAVCNPSRTSLMTGMRPDSIGVTSNHVHFRDKHPHVVTLPQYFKQSGYHAAAIGKLYHGVFPDGASKTKWDTMGDAVSWSVPATRFGPRYYYTEEGSRQAQAAFIASYRPQNPQPDDWTHKLVFGPMTEAPEVSDNTLYDGKVADAAVSALRALQADAATPFFLAVGFIKPHTPFVAPKKYWDLYEPDSIALANHQELPQNAPALAGHGSGEVRRYTDQPKQGTFTDDNQRRLRHGYYACISFIDAQIGRVLSELDRLQLSDNTIVLLYGDHGWHLGEHGLWGKTTNFELDTRAPLIIRAPTKNASGRRTRSLVEFVDIYPTLADLAGLAIPDKLEGQSLRPLIAGAGKPTKTAAYSQYPRGKRMGYSMRTDRWRYTEWIDQASKRVFARELYDHQTDDAESVNVASDESHSNLIAALSATLHTSLKIPTAAPQEQPPGGIGTGFEALPAGPLTDVKDESGGWTAAAGHATIHTPHHRTGKQCLRLLGGPEHQVVWTPALTDEPIDRIDFWFERWTRRQPFDFRVEALVNGEWKTLHHDRQKAVVGSFRNHLSLPIGSLPPVKYRFTSTTPANSGVMIDDLQLIVARAMRIEQVATRQSVVPVLIRNEVNPILDIQVRATGSLQPRRVTELHVSLEGTTELQDILHAEAFVTGTDASLPWRDIDALAVTGTKFGERQPARKELIFRGDYQLGSGTNHFFVSVKLRDGADMAHRIQASCTSITSRDSSQADEQAASLSQPVDAVSPAAPLRIGYAVRKANDDDSKAFRIPGLATTNAGSLIAVYDVRRRGWGDLPGDIDVGMSRSSDGGRTWEPMKVIMDMGDDPEWRFDGIGDPAVLVDDNTGTIWVAATWSHGNRSWVGSGPGLEPEQTGQFMLVKSDDDGLTWSEPINITKQVKKPEWSFILQGPGRGITMQDGTLVFPAQYQDAPQKNRLPHSTIIYSRDHGESWHVGTGAFDDTTESAVAEIEAGVLMLNCRYNRQNRRVVMTTRDLGTTWQEHPTSRKTLPEPGSCMGSLVSTDKWLLFSNPNVGDSPRRRMTIKASDDQGLTWPAHWHTLIDEEASAGYSCLTMIDESTVGVLFEGSRAHMAFLRIPLAELTHIPDGFRASDKAARATKLRLPLVFQDHLVLQRDVPIPVWGTGPAGGEVSVSFGSAKVSTQVTDRGTWSVELPPQSPSATPRILSIATSAIATAQSIEIKDVLVGEVWLAAGQSNMEWPLEKTDNGQRALQQASDSEYRLFYLRGAARGGSGEYTKEHLWRLTSERFCRGTWQRASADSARDFSAVAYYFGRSLRQQLDVPVGVICPAIGGTPTESWIRRAALDAEPDLASLARGNWIENDRLSSWCRQRATANLGRAWESGDYVAGNDLGPNHSFKPGFMWDAAIRPLVPFPIRGVIWYQGESNAESGDEVKLHRHLFPTLVHDWREQWRRGDFPFLYVQLPGMKRPQWPAFRDDQRRFLNDLPNMGMAVTIDLGHPTNVHPTRKLPVGERLANWALSLKYGKPIRYSGPLIESARCEQNEVVVTFQHAEPELLTTDGEPPRHFEVAGADGKFFAAAARIEGQTIVAGSEQVPNPQHVRYAWTAWPDPPVNLSNAVGLPASPFVVAVRE